MTPGPTPRPDSAVPPHRAGPPPGPAPPQSTGAAGPVPEDNQPGHHPDVEQDRPGVSPDVWRLRHGAGHLVPFELAGPVGWAARMFGVRPDRDGLHLVRGALTVSYGPWKLATDLDNVVAVEVTGPYWWPKVVGPPHLSLRDHGVTFATNDREGLCLRFREPVPAILPFGHLPHPGVTVTIGDPARVARAITDELGLA